MLKDSRLPEILIRLEPLGPCGSWRDRKRGKRTRYVGNVQCDRPQDFRPAVVTPSQPPPTVCRCVVKVRNCHRLAAAGHDSHANSCGRRYLTSAGSSGGCPLYLGTCTSVRRSGRASQPLGEDVRPTTAPAGGELVLSTQTGRRSRARIHRNSGH